MPSFAPRSLLTYQGTHPLVLDVYLLQQLGPEYYEWEPETVWREAVRVTGAPNVSEVNRNKIQAVRTVHLADTSFKRWEVFEKIIMALNGVVPRFDVMQKPDLGQLLFGVSIMQQLRGEKLSDEVVRYIAAALLTDGLSFAPDPIQKANQLLKEMHPMHGAVKDQVAKGGPDQETEEGVSVQLSKLQEGLLYKKLGSQRLLEQMKVLDA